MHMQATLFFESWLLDRNWTTSSHRLQSIHDYHRGN